MAVAPRVRPLTLEDYAAVGIPHYWALDSDAQAFHEFFLPPGGAAYECVVHVGGRVRPRLFADRRPPLTLDLGRLW